MSKREEMEKGFEKLLADNAKALARMSENNGALLDEYKEAVETIYMHAHFGIEPPEGYAKAVVELRDEIVRRMNRGAGQ